MAAPGVLRLLALRANNNFTPFVRTCAACAPPVVKLTACQGVVVPVRTSTGFVGRLTANEVWETMTSVSNAGRKRGRAKGLRRRVNLNIGQKLGHGKSGFKFPGLTGPALVGNKPVRIHEVKTEKPPAIPMIPKRKRMKIPALQRGYAGRSLPGTSIGPPDPIYDYTFEGFDTKVIEYKLVNHMTGNMGRKMRLSSFVVTGNGNGLAGYALAKSEQGKASLRKAKNMAGQRLQFVERYNNHTVFHDFFVQEGNTKLFVKKRPKGHGLRCHRIVKTICQMVGIEDLYCKLEGKSNPQRIAKAFFRGLMEQETHQTLADRMKLNVVEFRPEYENYPVVVASPSDGRVSTEPIEDENWDFDLLYYDGKVPLIKNKIKDFPFLKLESYQKWAKIRDKHRNQKQAMYERIVYGLEPSEEEIERRKAEPIEDELD